MIEYVLDKYFLSLLKRNNNTMTSLFFDQEFCRLFETAPQNLINNNNALSICTLLCIFASVIYSYIDYRCQFFYCIHFIHVILAGETSFRVFLCKAVPKQFLFFHYFVNIVLKIF